MVTWNQRRIGHLAGYIAIFMAHAAVLRDRPPFSPLGAFLDADDDDNDEDTNKGSNSWMIKPARNKPDGYEKQNLKQSSRFKKRSSLSLTIVRWIHRTE